VCSQKEKYLNSRIRRLSVVFLKAMVQCGYLVRRISGELRVEPGEQQVSALKAVVLILEITQGPQK
jgi:hypothetical protein